MYHLCYMVSICSRVQYFASACVCRNTSLLYCMVIIIMLQTKQALMFILSELSNEVNKCTQLFDSGP